MPPPNPFQPWHIQFIALMLICMVHQSTPLVSTGKLPKELQDCYDSFANINLRDVVGQSVCWSCEAPAIMRLRARDQPEKISESAEAYISRLLRRISDHCTHGKKPQRPRKCIRKEYRMLSDEERKIFHGALNSLKQDRSVTPNKYDAIARLHSGTVISSAHGGPNFLGWHRVYTLLMEIALQEVDPRVCMPYWASSLDSELKNPVLSHVFSKDFFGSGRENHSVTDGPFAGWVTPDHGPLIRNIGANGQLFNTSNIKRIFAQRRMNDISPPNGRLQNGLEFQHNAIHVYIGGLMDNLQSAAFDPVFFLHHAYVDYLWEEFRKKQRQVGTDPQLDYPDNFGSPLHAPGNLIGLHTLNITIRQGLSNRLTDTYDYQPSPTCSRSRPTCGSKYLKCNVQKSSCIPVAPQTKLSRPAPGGGCPNTESKPPMGIQNTYCIDGVCDMRGWVYVPVKVVSTRSPDLKTYGSYPVYNGSIMHSSDIYMPSAYAETSTLMSKHAPKKYDKCHDGNGIGQIFIQSSGISYNGFYKESVIIDQRLATSMAIGYIAVKNPKQGPAKALFRAFDSCGRICHPGCRIPGTSNFQLCPGVLDISDVPGQPKQYSTTYGQATMNTWGYSKNHHCPNFLENDIALTFYCDYKEKIPWSKQSNSKQTTGQIKERIPVPRAQFKTTTTPRNVIKRIPLPSSKFHTNVQPSRRYECKIDTSCTVNRPCEELTSRCSGRKYKCRNTCHTYAVCRNGKYAQKFCPSNWSFNGIRCDSSLKCFGSRVTTNTSNRFRRVNHSWSRRLRFW